MESPLVIILCLGGLLLLLAGDVVFSFSLKSSSSLSHAQEAISNAVKENAEQIEQACHAEAKANAKAGATLQKAVQDAINKNNGVPQGGTMIPDIAEAVQAFLVTTGKNAAAKLDTVLGITRQAQSKVSPAIAKLMAAIRANVQSGKMTSAEVEAWVKEQNVLDRDVEKKALEECRDSVRNAKKSLDASALQMVKALIRINPDKLEGTLVAYVNDAIKEAHDQMDDGVDDLDRRIQMFGHLMEALTVY